MMREKTFEAILMANDGVEKYVSWPHRAVNHLE